jgi:hypothetical protein
MTKSIGSLLCSALAFGLLSMSSSQAQTVQASCTFRVFSLSSNPQSIWVTGVNDYGSVVGYANFGTGTPPQSRAFIHYSGGGTSYWLPSGAKSSAFGGRNNAGVTTGAYVDAANQRHAFLLKGSTLSPIVRPFGGGPAGINKYSSVVGVYTDSNGHDHGFKRYSDGNIIHLSYPGAINTGAVGINDSGLIVGTYLGTDSAEHGFIYKGGQWAKLQFPNATQSTELFGISNSNVIVGQGQAHGYMYKTDTCTRMALQKKFQCPVLQKLKSGLSPLAV